MWSSHPAGQPNSDRVRDGLDQRDLRTPKGRHSGSCVRPDPLHRRGGNMIQRLLRAWDIFAAAVLEIFDEAPYRRFLERTGAKRSVESYRQFIREREAVTSRRPRSVDLSLRMRAEHFLKSRTREAVRDPYTLRRSQGDCSVRHALPQYKTKPHHPHEIPCAAIALRMNSHTSSLNGF